MYRKNKIILIVLLLGIWLIDFIDMRYFYYFYDKKPHAIWGMTLHFTVVWRYVISAIKWVLTVALFPRFFSQHTQKIVWAFLTLVILDMCTVFLMKKFGLPLKFAHNIIFQIIRLKVMNNYFLVLIGGLAIINQLMNYHEQRDKSKEIA